MRRLLTYAGTLAVLVSGVWVFWQHDHDIPSRDYYHWFLSVKDSPETLEQIQQRLATCRSASDSLHHLGVFLERKNKFDITLGEPEAHATRRIASTLHHEPVLGYAYLKIAEILLGKGHQDTLVSAYIDSANLVADRLNDPVLRYACLSTRAVQAEFRKHFNDALRYWLQAEYQLEQHAPWAEPLLSNTRMAIADRLTTHHLHDLVPRQMEKVNVKALDRWGRRDYYEVCFSESMQAHHYDSADHALDVLEQSGYQVALRRVQYLQAVGRHAEGIAWLRKILDNVNPQASYINIKMYQLADLYLAQQQYDSALFFIRSGIIESRKKIEYDEEGRGYLLMGKVFHQQGFHDSAAHYTSRAQALAHAAALTPLLRDTYTQEEAHALAAGRFDVAYRAARSRERCDEQLDATGSATGMRAVYLDHVSAVQREQVQLIQRQADTIRMVMGMVILLLIIIVAGGYVFFRARRKQLAEVNALNIALSHSNQELDEMVQLRTQELALKNVVLQQRNQQLEEYAFLNAHRLRAPVARLLGLANLFRLEHHEPHVMHLVDMIDDQTRELDEVVHSIQRKIENEQSIS